MHFACGEIAVRGLGCKIEKLIIFSRFRPNGARNRRKVDHSGSNALLHDSVDLLGVDFEKANRPHRSQHLPAPPSTSQHLPARRSKSSRSQRFRFQCVGSRLCTRLGRRFREADSSPQIPRKCRYQPFYWHIEVSFGPPSRLLRGYGLAAILLSCRVCF